MLSVFISIKQRVCFSFRVLQERISCWIKPRTTSLALGALADLTRGKAELLAENALLRHQLNILRRQIKRPVCQRRDRLLLVLLARMVRAWKQAIFLVQPETLLRWHHELFCVFWKRKSQAHARKPRLSPEKISLIKEMAANNRLWGAQRIRGELLKLGKLQSTSSGIMTRNSGRILHEWQPPVASRCFERRVEPRKRMLCVSVFWGA